MYGLERLTYLCLKGDTHTDFYTAFATEELRATPPTVLCSVSLSITVYTKTRNPAALVFIPICAGRRAGMRIFMRTKEELPACPVATAVSLIGGKWKLLILRNLKVRPWRFNELQRDIDGISQKVLTDSLRQMMSDGLAYRHDYQEQPPRVEYGLTELGKQMLPIVDALADFGNYYKSVVGQNENA